MAIFLLSDPIRTGKTTRLLNWAKTRRDVGGILTPEQNGLRVLVDISLNEQFTFQVTEEYDNIIQIGRFFFSSEAFQTGRNIIARERGSAKNWLVIDEVGPLELQGQGFEPEISNTIDFFKKQNPEKNLLLVVRQNLLNEVLRHYKIDTFQLFKFPAP